jgi:hypothetical protein
LIILGINLSDVWLVHYLFYCGRGNGVVNSFR